MKRKYGPRSTLLNLQSAGIAFGIFLAGLLTPMPVKKMALLGILAAALGALIRWIMVRFTTVERDGEFLSGPNPRGFGTTNRIALSQVDRERTKNRAFLAKYYDYWDVWSLEGDRVRLHEAILGPESTQEILRELGVEYERPRWARTKHRVALGVMLTLLGLFAAWLFTSPEGKFFLHYYGIR